VLSYGYYDLEDSSLELLKLLLLLQYFTIALQNSTTNTNLETPIKMNPIPEVNAIIA